MKYYLFHIVPFVLIGIIVMALFILKTPESMQNGAILNESPALEPAPAEFSNDTRTNEEGEVTVEITPALLQEHENAEFDVSFNTHTRDLSMDMLKITTLTDSAGKMFTPLSWDGPAEGGHHISGKLIFPPLADPDAGFTLTLRNIGDIPERTFEWKKSN